MARTTLTYGGKNLNDGTIWSLMPGAELGERAKTYDEVRSYTGSVAQYNVSEAHLIHGSIPLRLQGTSEADIDAEVAALNALIDAGAQTLIFGSRTLSCVQMSRVSYVYAEQVKALFRAYLDLVIVRSP